LKEVHAVKDGFRRKEGGSEGGFEGSEKDMELRENILGGKPE
jgi:hypothetical protein